MQPDSEIHKRLRAVTSKDSTPRRNSPKNLKKTPSAISTPTTTKKQTDLTRFLSKFDNKTPNNVVLTTDVSQDLPNSKLVDKFSELISYSSEEGFLRRKELDVLKSVTHEEAIKDTISHLETAEENENVLTTNISSAVKRTYIQEDSNLVDNVKQFSSQYNNLNISRTPRRSAIMALQNISLMSLEQSISSTSRGNNRTKIIAKEMDISAMQEENTPKSQKKVKRRTSCTAKDLDISVASPKIKKRRTLYTPRLTSIESEQVDTTNIDLMTSTPTQDKNKESSKSSQSDSTPQTSKTLVKRMLTPFASSTLIFQSSQSDFSEPMSTVENVGTLTRNESHTSFLSTKSEVSNDHLDTTISDELKTPVQEKFNNTNGNLLIDEHANVFSSSRQPGNRLSVNKTLMDIVSQRVQNINKSARRSLLPPTIHSELEMHRKFLNSEMLSQCTPKEPLTVTVKTTTLNCDSCDIPSEVYSTEQVLQEDRNATATPPVAIKKRKLFMPNESPLPQSNDNKHTSNINTNKRRKTILPTVQKQPSPSAAPPSSPPPRPPPISVITPLTTFANNKMTDSKNANSADANQDDIFLNKKAAESFSKALEIKAQNAKSDKQKTINIYKKAKLSSVRGKKKASHIVCTNMHSKEVESTREAIKKLGCFQLEKRVTNETTHIITTDPKRTLNLLRGLVRGLWILKYDWINESLNAGKWLYEEPFEIHEFSRAIKICRAERQAFGKKYRSELFSELEPFFVSSECHNISKDDLEELIELGGGRVVQHRKQAKYIVCDKKSNKENKIHVTYFWVLDSLTQMELRRIHPYSPKGCELELVAPQEMPKSYDDSKSVHYNPNINPRNV
ncbi:uncharacterized protein LOC119678629 [Teleopsis dalmanni]|uniref:uncharacterized protein LOC119678629 n=1 Tax=Teleopsis dalmanni TaxID=139649 RepID=UPI0018CD1DA2|nr:uncharacterized protein LOC119678629 [Teleopsis dalmanni]